LSTVPACTAAKSGAPAPWAQHSHDWPTGDIVGRTEGGWLVYHDGETSQTRVLFADWLNTSQA
jgi:hypothetical protein